MNIRVDDSLFPVQHGALVKYTCPKNSMKIDGSVKAVCASGKISLYPENVSPCNETST